jgi:hypothetical protein
LPEPVNEDRPLDREGVNQVGEVFALNGANLF